jgi:hypothetical protein
MNFRRTLNVLTSSITSAHFYLHAESPWSLLWNAPLAGAHTS